MIVTDSVSQCLARQAATGGRFIVAVSGGKDSMALLHACRTLQLDVVAAHANFMLRGESSMLDEAFVGGYCRENNIPFETTRFDTENERKKTGTSVQETARSLRYEWFEQLRIKHRAEYIFTAHHANDVAETFFLNLLRGSGPKGLRSIPEKNGPVLRPLLHVPASEIEAYTRHCRVPYRDDESNRSDKYKRNYIRHHIIPLLEQVNPRSIAHIVETTALLSQAQAMLEKSMVVLKNEYTERQAHSWVILLDKLLHHPEKDLLLFEWLHPLGFPPGSIRDIGSGIPAAGSKWLSHSHSARYSRGKLLISEHSGTKAFQMVLHEWPDTIVFGNQVYEVTETAQDNGPFLPHTIYMDKALVTFPVTLRSWKEGDSFIPQGMKGRKKVSDFFIDAKIDQEDKHRAMIVESGDGIIAVAPYRVSDRFKVTPGTQQVIRLSLA